MNCCVAGGTAQIRYVAQKFIAMSSIDDRIHQFRSVQEMPYRLTRDGVGDCNCITKSRLLGQKLSDLGLGWRYGMVEFSWGKLGLPREIAAISHDDPVAHKFLEVRIPETGLWEIVDPTWDPGLASIFEIAKWDGTTSTGSAVPILKTLTEQECDKHYALVKTEEFRKGWYERNNEFSVALNDWFERTRAKAK